MLNQWDQDSEYVQLQHLNLPLPIALSHYKYNVQHYK